MTDQDRIMAILRYIGPQTFNELKAKMHDIFWKRETPELVKELQREVDQLVLSEQLEIFKSENGNFLVVKKH